MAQLRSIESIEDVIRLRADRPSTLRPTSDDIMGMARESWRDLHSRMAGKADTSREYSTGNVSVVSGTRSYDLPSDCWKVVGVKVADSSVVDGYRVLERFQWDERHDYAIPTTLYDTRYEIRGGKVYFAPTPSWSGTAVIEYIPFASWTQLAGASAPTTASTQATGAGNTVWRINVAAATVAVGNTTTTISATADFVIHSGSLLVTNGQSCRATIVAKNVSGVISVVAVKGSAATTGTELAPTKAQIQTAVGAGNSWTRLANCCLNRTGDTTVTQTQGSVDCIDASNGADEWLVCDVAAKIKAIDEEDASYFIGQRDAIWRRLAADAVVDAAKPKQVANRKRRGFWGRWR